MPHDEIRFEEEVDRLRIWWDNRDIHRDGCLLWFLRSFSVVWLPATCFATAMIFLSDSPIFFVIWCVFGWSGTFALTFVFVQLLWGEWIEINTESLSWGATGPFARATKKLPLARIAELGLGRYRNRDDYESMVSLNVYEAPNRLGFMPCHLIGYWLSAENKEVVFDRVRKFVLERSLPLKVVIYQGKLGTHQN